MKTGNKVLFAAVAALAGGFVAGIVYSSRQGQEFRRMVSTRARTGTERISEQLHEIEHKLERIEHRIEEQVSRAVERNVPGVPDESKWSIDSGDVAHDLGRMPHE